MHKASLIFGMILALLVVGCSPQQSASVTPSGGDVALPQVIEPSPNSEAGTGQESAYPPPAAIATPPDAAYPAPESGVAEPGGAYPPPSGQTGNPEESPYPAPGQITDNNVSSPMNPIPGEEKLTRAEVFIDKSEVSLLTTNPTKAGLSLTGSLPTPCHYLRVKVSPPDAENKIAVEVYSLVDPSQVCIQVLQPFETTLDLGTFAAGTYTVWVNGQQVGEYTQ